MAANPFDKFDSKEANPFDQFDAKKEQDNPLYRGYKGVKSSVGLSADLAVQDYDAAAANLAEQSRYNKANPGSEASVGLQKAWQEGDGITGGISNVVNEIGSDFKKSDGFGAKVGSVKDNLKAMGSGILAQTPNMVLPMGGMVAGGVAGTAVAPGAGTVAGMFTGASAGNAMVGTSEAAMRQLQKAGIDPEDTTAVRAYLKENSGSILGETAVKGSVIGAVDTATMGLGHFLLTQPGKLAADKALIQLGVDGTDKAAVQAAKKSDAFKALVETDAAYLASKTGAGNAARNIGAAALEPAGEFVGEYAGSMAATGEADAKDAFLEAASSLGQGAVTFAGQKMYAGAKYPFKPGENVSGSEPAPEAAPDASNVTPGNPPSTPPDGSFTDQEIAAFRAEQAQNQSRMARDGEIKSTMQEYHDNQVRAAKENEAIAEIELRQAKDALDPYHEDYIDQNNKRITYNGAINVGEGAQKSAAQLNLERATLAHRNAVYAARDAEEARRQSFMPENIAKVQLGSGSIGKAAAAGIDSGAIAPEQVIGTVQQPVAAKPSLSLAAALVPLSQQQQETANAQAAQTITSQTQPEAATSAGLTPISGATVNSDFGTAQATTSTPTLSATPKTDSQLPRTDAESIRPHVETLTKRRKVISQVPGISNKEYGIAIEKAKLAMQSGRGKASDFTKLAKLFAGKDAQIHEALTSIANALTPVAQSKEPKAPLSEEDKATRAKLLAEAESIGIKNAKFHDIAGITQAIESRKQEIEEEKQAEHDSKVEEAHVAILDKANNVLSENEIADIEEAISKEHGHLSDSILHQKMTEAFAQAINQKIGEVKHAETESAIVENDAGTTPASGTEGGQQVGGSGVAAQDGTQAEVGQQEQWQKIVDKLNELNPQLKTKLTVEIIESTDPRTENHNGGHNSTFKGGHNGSSIILVNGKADKQTLLHEMRHMIDMLLGGYQLRKWLKSDAVLMSSIVEYLKSERAVGNIDKDSRMTDEEETAQSFLDAYYRDKERLRSKFPDVVQYLEAMGADKYSEIMQAPGFELEGQTNAEIARQEAAAAKAKAEAEKEAPAKNVTSDQVDMFNTQGGIFNQPGTSKNPVAVENNADLKQAEQLVNTEPTDAQKEAGNYAKAHVQWNGLDITIENPAGSERSGTDSDGEQWSVTMPASYGYIKRTEGADGDHVDVYIGKSVNSKKVFVIDQLDIATGKFDEHKNMLGFLSQAEAERIYKAGFSDGKGAERMGAITEMSVDEFKTWLADGDTTKPLAFKQNSKLQNATAPEVIKPAAPVNEYAAKWFGTQAKAAEFIKIKKAEATHEVVSAGKSRFEIHLKQKAEPVQEPKAKPTQFANNKIFTQSAVDAARARMKKKLGTVNSGIDPEMFQDGVTLAGAYIESGARSFADYSKAMIDDLGDAIKPYLRSFYEGVRHYPGIDAAGMSTAAELDLKEGIAESKETPEQAAEKESNPAIGKVQKPAKRAKAIEPHDVVLREDYGVSNIDGYGYASEKSERAQSDVKRDFLADAKKYLQSVEKTLSAIGFSAHTDKKGKPGKAVSVNESGMAVSGDVSLTMAHPETGLGIYITIGGSSIRGVVPTSKSGVSVMMRVANKEDKYGSRGQNRWMPVNLTAHELAMAADSAVAKSIKITPKETNDLKLAFNVGQEAFKAGKPRITPNTGSIERSSYPDTVESERQWYMGWDTANLAEPVPGVITRQFAAYKEAIESGKWSKGMAEIASLDDRLNDGEYEELASLADKKQVQSQAAIFAKDLRTGDKVEFLDHVGHGGIFHPGDTAEVVNFTGTAVQFKKLNDNKFGGVAWLDHVRLNRGQPDTFKLLETGDKQAHISSTGGTENAGSIQTDSVPGTDTQIDPRRGPSWNRAGEPLDDGMAEAGNGATRGERVPASLPVPGGTGTGNTGAAGTEYTPDQNGAVPDVRPIGGAANGDGSSLDHTITDADEIGSGGLTKKFNDNIAAIKILKTLDAESRTSTPEERKQLARYVGFGALKGVFDKNNKQWPKQYAELKELLTAEEYESARASVLNAHYTSKTVVDAMFEAVKQLGFAGGRILEPSVGSGNFFGMMPAALRNASTLHGVELDLLTSKLAKALYPKANIAVATGFQEYQVPAGYFDMAIGNPPFGSEPIVDKERNAYSGFSIHNYFIARMIDKVRDGGIVPVIVSHSFMDAMNPKSREWVAQRANLIAAVRLPDTAFQENAGTEVVTDILFFQKTATPEKNPVWLNSSDMTIANPKTKETASASVNDYFQQNKQNVLGEESAAGTMYVANSYTVTARKGNLRDHLIGFINTLPANIYTPIERITSELDSADNTIPDGVKQGSYFVAADGTIKQRGNDVAGSQTSTVWQPKNDTAAARMTSMISLRDKLRAQMRMERDANSNVKEIEKHRKDLNKAYDEFNKKFGYINSQVNRGIFMDDTEAALLQSIEFDYDKGVSKAVSEKNGIDQREASAKKADILERRVLFPNVEKMNVASAKDALLASLDEKGRVDLDYMTQAYSKTQAEIVKELGDVLYLDPATGDYVMADEYLSGDVKTKLVEAKKAADDNSQYNSNVSALEKIIPVDKMPSEIFASLGAGWIPAATFQEFAKEVTGSSNIDLVYVGATAQWMGNINDHGDVGKMNSDFGTNKINAFDLFKLLLNGRAPEIKMRIMRDGKEAYVTDEEATEAAREKSNKIRGAWEAWIWKDGERAEKLAAIFNDKHNRIVERKFDGSHLVLHGSTPTIKMRKHQLDSAWRMIQDRVVLLDHVVGAGKTFAIVSAVMEMKRLGIARKPIIVVPNHLTLQWRSDFSRLYPAANVLAATPDDFSKGNRERMFSKIALGEYDAVIIGHSSLTKIGLDPAIEQGLVNEQIKEISDAIEAAKTERGDRGIVRDMEKIKANLQAKVDALILKAGERDKVVTFDELGVDAIMVDEMHEFKNLFFVTQMQRVAGLGNPKGSGKAFDMFGKIRWLKQTYGEKAPLITATGTPVSNSLSEMYTMQRYMKYDELKRDGLHLFDAWARMYGDVESLYEVAPSGVGYRISQRFSKFKNLPSLMAHYKTFADTVTLQDLKDQSAAEGTRFPVPKMEGGKPQNIVAQRSDVQTEYFGVPHVRKDEAGNIVYGIDYDKAKIEEGKDGKWILSSGHSSSSFTTKEDAELELVSRALTPELDLDPKSLLGQFANLKQLTRDSKGKINALSLTGLASKAGLDMRIINPSAPDFDGSKINKAVGEMMRVYGKWTKDKGTQLVFCDLSVPASARTNMANKGRRLYVLDDKGMLTHKTGTLHTVEGHDGFPFYLVKAKDGIDLYDPVSGSRLKSNIPDKATAKAWVASLLTSESARDKWLENRERVEAITPERITEYRDANELEVAEDGSNEVSMDDLEAVAGSSQFSVYDDIKAKLVAQGVPEKEIAFIHDYDTPAKKTELFKSVNRGDVRFLMGSTPKLGAGTNVQQRLVGLHHIDAPWRPSDLEQREGRIIRQGNKLYERDPEAFEVFVGRYATEQTYDTRRWQLLEHKAAGIEQLRKYSGELEIDDVAGEASNSADMKAAASGNPMILEETKLRTDVKRLETLQRGHADSTYAMQRNLSHERNRVASFLPRRLDAISGMLEAVKANPALHGKDAISSIAVDGKNIKSKEAAENAIAEIAKKVRVGSRQGGTIVYRGVTFELKLGHAAHLGIHTEINEISGYSEKDAVSPSGMITRFDNFIDGLEERKALTEHDLEKAKADVASMEARINAPFEDAALLEQTKAAHSVIQRKLMKATQIDAVPMEERAAFNNELAARKKALAGLGYEKALRELDNDSTPKFSRSKSYPELAAALEKYEGTGELATVQDLANEVDALIDEDLAPESLQSAIEDYRQEVADDHAYAGRGDMEAADERFVDAVHAALAAKQSRTTQPVINPHTQKSAESAMLDAHTGADRKALQALLDSGKARVITAQQAQHVTGDRLNMVAWHGSPHDHDKFDSSKIGTGEGAQAYGYGLYFAGSRGVAEYYKNALSTTTRAHTSYKGKKLTDSYINDLRNNGTKAEKMAFSFIPNSKIKSSGAIKFFTDLKDSAEQQLKYHQDRINKISKEDANGIKVIRSYDKNHHIAAADHQKNQVASYEEIISEFKREEERKNGKLYEVELAPAEDEYLLWDRPLSEQSDKVKAALEKAGLFDGSGKAESDYADRYAAAVKKEGGNADAVKQAILNLVRNKEMSDKDWNVLIRENPQPKGFDLNDIHDEYRPAYWRSVLNRTTMERETVDATKVGETLYREIDAALGQNTESASALRDIIGISEEEAYKTRADVLASKLLHSLGIRGIKYLDGSSRPSNVIDSKLNAMYERNGKDIEKTVNEFMRTVHNTPKEKAAIEKQIRKQLENGYNYNYVIFNDADVSITAKYSKDGRALAFFNQQDGITYFIADNIPQGYTAEEWRGLVLHEIGVHAFQLGKDSAEFKDILKQVELMNKTGNKNVRAAFERAINAGVGTINDEETVAEYKIRKEDYVKNNAEIISEEAVAYLVQESPELPIVKRIVAWFRNAIRTIGKNMPVMQRARFFEWAAKLNENDILYMAQTAMVKSVKTETQREYSGEGVKASLADSLLLAKVFVSLGEYADTAKYAKSDKKDMAGISAEINAKITIGKIETSPERYVNDEGSMAYRDKFTRWDLKAHDGHPVYVTANLVDKTIWINAIALEEGVSGGAAIYQLVGQYAANNGLVFIGDPDGVGNAAMYRRTENMIALAIKSGTTAFIRPHPDQLKAFNGPRKGDPNFFWPGMKWKDGDHVNNLQEMLNAAYSAIAHHVPEIKNVIYDTDTQSFRNTRTGQPFSRADFIALSETRGGRLAHTGWSTLERAALVNSVSSGAFSGAAWRESLVRLASGNMGGGIKGSALQDIRYSRTSGATPRESIIGDTGRTRTPEQLAAFRNVGRTVQVPTLKERAQGIWKDAGKKLAQGMVDQFRPIRDLSSEAYALMRLSKGASGAFEVMLKGGQLKLQDGVYDFDDAKKGGVIDRLLTPLQGEADDFFWWVAANRAEKLSAQDREHLFTPQDIAAMKSLADGKTGYDYTLQHGPNKGKTTRDRAEVYADSLKTFNEFHKNTLDMAEQSGLIDGDARKHWESEFYVPFYRVEEDEGGVRGMNIKSGVTRQQAFKQLKGGTGKLNADLLENSLMNWAHLLDAAAKNRAAKASLEAAARVNVATEVPEGTKKAVWFMDKGQKRHFTIEDPLVMDALSALEFAGMRSPLMNAMGAMKHALTIGVTASPFFKVRNLIRDSVHSIAVSGLNYNVADNLKEGWKLTNPKSDAYFRLLAGGGTIHFGTMFEGSESKRVRSLVEAGVDESTILDSENKYKAFYKRVIEPSITAYNELGNRGEAVNRASLYDQLIKQGKSHAEASLMARDLMDFSMQGSWTSIRFLTQTVPFLNARLQGLYKLGRAAQEDPKKFGIVLGAVAMASVALMLAYSDDEDWKKREDWDRDAYWWFKIGGEAFRIPKPFEIGAIASVAERGIELFSSDEMTGERFGNRMYQLLSDNLSMNPIPQVVKPMLDIYANKDSFTGRPIESMGMEHLDPEYRFTQRTSMAARAASTGTGGAMSPVQIDHLIRGYFGWLGTFIIGSADVIAKPASGQMPGAATDWMKTATGGIIAGVEDAPSRYVTQMYNQAKEVEQAHVTWKYLQKTDPAAAMEYRQYNIELLRQNNQLAHIKKAESAMNLRIRMIERSEKSPDEKRILIRAINAQKELVAKRAIALHP